MFWKSIFIFNLIISVCHSKLNFTKDKPNCSICNINGLVDNFYDLSLYCNAFDSFNQINFECFNQNYFIRRISFSPRKPLILGQSLALDRFKPNLQVNSIDVNISNLAGIYMDQNAFEKFQKSLNYVLNLRLTRTVLAFYQNDSTDPLRVEPIFSSFYTIIFGVLIEYKSKISPLLFRNSLLSFVYFYEIKNTF